MKTMTMISFNVESHREAIIEQVKNNVIRTHKRMAEVFGENMSKSSWSVSSEPWQNIRRLFDCVDAGGKAVSSHIPNADIHYVVNGAKLQRYAEAEAQVILNSWKAKVERKVGLVDSYEILYHTGNSYTIIFTADGMDFIIEQDMILNTSVRGNLFNQFPARIYHKINGVAHAISEKKYKELRQKVGE